LKKARKEESDEEDEDVIEESDVEMEVVKKEAKRTLASRKLPVAVQVLGFDFRSITLTQQPSNSRSSRPTSASMSQATQDDPIMIDDSEEENPRPVAKKVAAKKVVAKPAAKRQSTLNFSQASSKATQEPSSFSSLLNRRRK
jgi:autotransporter translocation and assembly factor TamB